jgi:hypothetical protein
MVSLSRADPFAKQYLLRLVFSFSAVPFVGIPFAIWIYLLGMNSAQPLPG